MKIREEEEKYLVKVKSITHNLIHWSVAFICPEYDVIFNFSRIFHLMFAFLLIYLYNFSIILSDAGNHIKIETRVPLKVNRLFVLYFKTSLVSQTTK
jgi:hypothetical protein